MNKLKFTQIIKRIVWEHKMWLSNKSKLATPHRKIKHAKIRLLDHPQLNQIQHVNLHSYSEGLEGNGGW